MKSVKRLILTTGVAMLALVLVSGVAPASAKKTIIFADFGWDSAQVRRRTDAGVGELELVRLRLDLRSPDIERLDLLHVADQAGIGIGEIAHQGDDLVTRTIGVAELGCLGGAPNGLHPDSRSQRASGELQPLATRISHHRIPYDQ